MVEFIEHVAHRTRDRAAVLLRMKFQPQIVMKDVSVLKIQFNMKESVFESKSVLARCAVKHSRPAVKLKKIVIHANVRKPCGNVQTQHAVHVVVQSVILTIEHSMENTLILWANVLIIF